MIVAEGEEYYCQSCGLIVLQWGRNLIVAEGRCRFRPGYHSACFNGAAT